MSRPEPPRDSLAEQVRAALADDAHELGIRVTVLAEHGRVALAGVVVTPERRARAAEIVRRVLPGFAVDDDIAVQRLDPPEPETLA